MRILLDQAVHHHRNKGNNALLEASLTRFREFWPEASFEVVSIAPHLCIACFPGTQPVAPHNIRKMESNLENLHRFMPRQLWYILFELREILYARTGRGLTSEQLRSLVLPRHRSGSQQPSREDIAEIKTDMDSEVMVANQATADLYENIAHYDLYVATGGGYMCDDDKRFLLPLFDRLEAAIAHGVPTVMVGQGVGPLEDPELLIRAKQVLPHVDYIMIREEKFARPILDSLGVPRSKAIMTGDDAIELTYQARRNRLGTGIGLSLRVATYTEVNEEHIERIRRVVQRIARKYDVELVAAPIDVNDADMTYINELMKGYGKTSSSWRKFESPIDIVKRVGRCRVMISGTFHGAVFALSQGIPVIALSKSVYQTMKVSGLAAEFGNDGCQVIQLEDEDLEKTLSEAIDLAWSSAERLRPQLLEYARRQIDLGHASYWSIYLLVEAKRQKHTLTGHQL